MALAIVSVIHKATLREGPVVYSILKEGPSLKINGRNIKRSRAILARHLSQAHLGRL